MAGFGVVSDASEIAQVFFMLCIGVFVLLLVKNAGSDRAR